MTKNPEFQQELNEIVKEGIKPSTIKKLKKSKSADDITNNNPPTPLLQEQLKEKQQQVENLTKKLEKKNSELSILNKEQSTLLDDNLSLKHQGLKDWFKEYEKRKGLEQELAENIDYASDELIKQDQVISSLRTENKQLKSTNQSLEKDLKLTERLAELRRVPLPDDNPNWDYLKPALYSLLAIGFTLWLLDSKPTP